MIYLALGLILLGWTIVAFGVGWLFGQIARSGDGPTPEAPPPCGDNGRLVRTARAIKDTER